MTKQQAKEQIEQLVERFDYHAADYRKGNYNETQTRNDFINQFFEALGWDVNNRQGLAECYREVIHEDKISISGSTKAPDYCFTVYGQRKFFLEAKKPSVNIKEQAEPAYQLRRYGWSAKMPISLITDFEELAIYDCTIKPVPTDKASVARIKYMTYKDYLKEFDFLWETFSKEQVLKGSFDKFVLSNKGKKGTTGVDAEFLKSLDGWRDLLARNIVNRNQAIGEDELNYSLQKIIDRLIFLRICEDRGVEREDQLRNAMGLNAFENLKQIFHIADQKYNSGLFDYKKDTITDNLVIDDKILKSIIEEMYYPKSPYEFSVIPVEILGHSYEQYLGKVIKITPGHRIKIEEKPEVRKAGGVYYTPQYIVDYIVKNTVGKLVDGKTPEEIAKIKICDPACGSGSFLLGAYQYLLDWHSAYYQDNIPNPPRSSVGTEASTPRFSVGSYPSSVGSHPSSVASEASTPRFSVGANTFLTPDGHLTTSIKKQILLNNIHGVDIDTNAVEVTKLSLMLKAMEGETEASINNQLSLYHERVLPTLDNNIKSGNSLIDLDFYDGKIDFEPETEKKIKPFNWENAFPEVFKQGGFDAVIGNPPYVNAIALIDLFPNERDYITQSINYKTTFQKWDLYIPFIEKGINILKKNGLISMIIPYPFITQNYAKLLRETMINDYNLVEIVDLSGQKIFKDATVTNCIFVLSKSEPTNHVQISSIQDSIISIIDNKTYDDIIQETKNSVWNLKTEKKVKICLENFKTLGDYCFISIGMVLNADEKKAKGKFIKDDLISDFETEICKKKYIEAKNIARYKIGTIRFLEWETPRVPSLIRRPTFPELYEVPKIIITKIGELKATYDSNNLYCDQTIRVVVLWKHLKGINNNSINNSVKRYSNDNRINLEINSEKIEYNFILGILNSKLGNYLLNQIRGVGNIDINPDYIKQIPIPANPNPETRDILIKLVESMLQLNKDLQQAVLPEQKEQIKARINYTDKKIDKLVYELYGLTEEEIKIVEGE
jgi:type I restriction-modification system DNA methylase subunit